MAMKTPDWILEGYDSKADWQQAQGKGSRTPTGSKKKGKTFKIKVCPKCGSDEIKVVIGGEDGKDSRGWECLKCKWKGKDVQVKEFEEDEFMKYLDDKDAREEGNES